MESKTSVTVTLVMNEREARLLMSLVQNSQSDCEDPQITELRRTVWDSLSASGLEVY